MTRTIVILLCFFAVTFCKIIPTYDLLRALPQLKDLSVHDDLVSSFAEFVSKYNKSYTDTNEALFRLKVFAGNMEQAAIQDERSRKLGPNAARYGMTELSDMTREEFSTRYLMNNMPPIPSDKLYPNHLESYSSIAKWNKSSIPAVFDWATTPGTVTPVYNQGSCGSCWAFSATENHESRFARQHNQAAVSMSVQQILDCDDPSQHGCEGGWPYLAWDYIYLQGGQDRWNCYPYQGSVGSCRWNGGCNAGSLVSWTWIFPNNEPSQAAWLYGNAPISICLDASQWTNYQSGIVYGSECSTNTDHCVLSTGYNLNSNPPYWIVRNSWGTGWGMSGYIYLEYNTNTCGLSQYPGSCHTVNG